MRRFVLVLILVSLGRVVYSQSIPQTPEHLRFCDIDLTINSGAREYIDNFIAKLHKSETYFASMVEKANTFLPIVEEAFRNEKVPDDLKYIVIQESAFNGKAVSKSGAVGYWQMKDASAREVGLVIDKYMDERKHIYRSSVGAARYFFRINRDFDNWVYAVLGYNRGPVGAKAFIDEKNFGKKHLLITAKTHWYVLKAIAYKVAFQDEVGKQPAKVQLQAFATGGESSVPKLIKERGIDKATLELYNPWIKGNTLPKGQNLIYYAPGTGSVVAAVEPVEEKPAPKEEPRSNRNPRRFDYLERDSDPDYGTYYAILKAGESLPEAAIRTGHKTAKIRELNGFKMSDRLQGGAFIMLKPAKKMRYHIVRPGDTWQIIAGKYNLDYKKLMKQNRTRELGAKLHPGQKVYLKGKKPAGEKIIILDTGQLKPRKEDRKPEKPAHSTNNSLQPGEEHGSPSRQRDPDHGGWKVESGSNSTAVSGNRPKPGKGKFHTVQAGETLWRISQNYGVTPEDLRKWNRLNGNEIYVGQRLKVGK